jgi:ribosome biogenesis protein UTP30
MTVVPTVTPKLHEALVALKQHLSNQRQTQEKPELLVDHDASDSVTLRFRLKMAGAKNAIRFEHVVVPHSLTEDLEACIIVRDPKDRATAAVDALKETANKNFVKKVIAIKSLKKKFKSPEMRRNLANRFSVFMAEEAVLEMMPDLLGRYFYDVKKAKIPFPIEKISDADISRVRNSTRFRLATGPVVGAKIGRLESMEISAIVENATAVIQAVEKFAAKKSNKIVAIEVQITDSLALPLYQLVAEEGAAEAPTADAKTGVNATKKKRAREESDESDGEEVVNSLASVSVKNLKRKLKK